MEDIFSKAVFEQTVIHNNNELFKGQGAAKGWADKLAKELGVQVEVKKIGNGWALCATMDGVQCTWGVYGQRLKRIDDVAQ
ncbi:hypothetical protein [Lacisediminimonas sp.]|uniref:hypothetical protein n=1 Tax=Lacisediminimonas sp. TaxID=3060582 RepID=UPI00271EFED0|nr:hypothetical protein [Lacisediminimonas sp.]MDO8301417.1 hypothetical protein [Lacisediminimonas sp.]